MGIEDDIVFLERVPTLGLLGRDALRILAIGAENRTLRPGDILFSAGDISDCGYVVLEGELSLTTPDKEGSRQTTVGRGTLLGELALLAETIRPTTATALDQAVAMRISRSLFLKTMEGFPEAARKLQDTLVRRTTGATRDIYGVRAAMDPGEID